MKIIEAVLALQHKVSYLNKDSTIDTKRGSYSIISHTHVLKAMRDTMIDLGLVLIPESYEVEKTGTVTTVNAHYKLYHLESGQSLNIGSVGQGEDAYDKGAGKASTYADKYVMMRLARLITGDDPDLVSNDSHDQTHEEMEELGNKLINWVNEKYAAKQISKETHVTSTDKVLEALAKKDFGALKEMAKKAGV